MFDLRYHVVSLTAVFLALVIGILVGVGLSGRGFVDNAEREKLERDIAALRSERDAARTQAAGAARHQAAAEDFAAASYDALAPGRLADRRIALVYVGSVDGAVDVPVRSAIREAGGTTVRMRALRTPLDDEAVSETLSEVPALRSFAGDERLEELGRALGRELVDGGRTPLWDTLSDTLVEERDGGLAQPVDAVVVARPAPPQQGPTQSFLRGLYSGLARSGVPAVGVDLTAVDRPAVDAFRRGGLSTVDGIDTDAGRLALVLLLGGSRPGHYGVEDTASDGIVPPIEPLEPTSG